MPHAPLTRPVTPRVHPVRRRSGDGLRAELRAAIADAGHLDLNLLGADPVRTAAEVSGRLDELARTLLDRMRAARWDEAAAPLAVTSVLAASVPAAEAVLVRAARSRGR